MLSTGLWLFQCLFWWLYVGDCDLIVYHVLVALFLVSVFWWLHFGDSALVTMLLVATFGWSCICGYFGGWIVMIMLCMPTSTACVDETGCVKNNVRYNPGDTWQDGCQYDCECLDTTGRYKCTERSDTSALRGQMTQVHKDNASMQNGQMIQVDIDNTTIQNGQMTQVHIGNASIQNGQMIQGHKDNASIQNGQMIQGHIDNASIQNGQMILVC